MVHKSEKNCVTYHNGGKFEEVRVYSVHNNTPWSAVLWDHPIPKSFQSLMSSNLHYIHIYENNNLFKKSTSKFDKKVSGDFIFSTISLHFMFLIFYATLKYISCKTYCNHEHIFFQISRLYNYWLFEQKPSTFQWLVKITWKYYCPVDKMMIEVHANHHHNT